MHPYFSVRNAQMHHQRRYQNEMRLSVYFYGDCTPEEMATARCTVTAIATQPGPASVWDTVCAEYRDVGGDLIMQDILLLYGSPKRTDSATHMLLEALAGQLAGRESALV